MAEAEAQDVQLEEARAFLSAAGREPLLAIRLLLEERRVLEARLRQCGFERLCARTTARGCATSGFAD